MSQNEKLDKLIKTVASEIVMLKPGSGDDTKVITDALSELSESLSSIEDLPDQLKAQIKGIMDTTKDKVVKVAENSDFTEDLAIVSTSVETLQGLIEQVGAGDFQNLFTEEPGEAVEEQKEEAPAEDSSETEAQGEGFVIPEDDVPLVADFASEALEHIEGAESALLDLDNDPSDKETINCIFRGFHTVKGMAGFLNLTDIGSLAHSAENLLDMARNDKIALTGGNMDVVFESLDMLKKMINSLNECVEKSLPVMPQEGLPAMLTKLEQCKNGELPDSSPEPEAKAEAVSEPEAAVEVEQETSQTVAADEAEPAEKAAAASKSNAAAKKIVNDEKIKVSMERLDNLVNMVGELVIAQSMVSQECSNSGVEGHSLSQHIAHQGKIVRELQELAMLMRMVPIQGVFQRMARLVRDLSRKIDKKVDFVTEGEETELDRIVVDQIADPLIHMIRNSVDHGIEPKEDRIAAGKSETGTVQLKAYHQAGNIIIEIIDDGRGLDREKIVAKAIEKEIISSAAEMSDSDVYKLIFAPGFSTAEKVTDVSGRGVGMDVVKRNIESLRGKIDIFSELGKGTTFSIKLPLTLAIIDGQLVRIGNDTYIVPIVSIDSCLKPNGSQVSTIRNEVEMAQVHGELLPIVRLNELFGIKADCEKPEDACLIVVEEDGKRGCLMVDEAMGQQQVVIKSLGEGIGKIKGVAGGAILGNGRVSLILDVLGILEVAWN